MKCWYDQTCSKYKTSECTENCIRFMEMEYMMQYSNIPKSKQFSNILIPCKQDLEAYIQLKKIKDRINEFVNNGQNIYIYSNNFGNGKTTWSIKLMQQYFHENWAGNGFIARGIFIHVPTFLTQIKQAIGTKNQEFETIVYRLPKIDLVVWDDIASTKLSDYDHSILLTYIDQRNLRGLSNIYTGNLEEKGMINALGNRLTSRIWNGSIQIEFVGIDRRGQEL